MCIHTYKCVHVYVFVCMRVFTCVLHNTIVNTRNKLSYILVDVNKSDTEL